MLGENKYDAEYLITFRNDGPGIVTRILLRVAMVISREPYQKVILTKITPDNYKQVEDEYGNTFAEFELSNIEAGKEVSVKTTYQVIVNQLKYRLEPCQGQTLTEFLKPERFIESDNGT